MKKNAEGAGELPPSTSAPMVSRRPSLPTDFSLSALSTSLHAAHQANLPIPIYNPLTEARKCASCGQHDGWRRLLTGTTVGGWLSCPRIDEPQRGHGEMAHACSMLCGLGGAA